MSKINELIKYEESLTRMFDSDNRVGLAFLDRFRKEKSKLRDVEKANEQMRVLLKAVEIDSRGIGSGVNPQLYNKILEAIRKYQ